MRNREILITLCIFSFLLILPLFFGSYFRSIFSEVFILGLFAASFNLIYGYTGMLSIAHCVFFGFGSYAFVSLILKAGFHFPLAVLVAIILTALLAIVMGFVVVRTHGHNLIALTVVFSQMFYLYCLYWREFTGGEDGLQISPIPIGNTSFMNPLISYYTSLICVFICFLLIGLVIQSPLGRTFVAIKSNEDRFKTLGYRLDVRNFKLISFVIGSTFAGLSGVLYSLMNSSANVENFQWVLSGEAIIWTMIGGAGTLAGPFVGTAVVLLAKEILSSELINYYPICIGAMLIIVALFNPGGLVAIIKEATVKLKR